MKYTRGKWKLAEDAQGPCMVMHPKKRGVAICSLTSTFTPRNGFYDPSDREPVQMPTRGLPYNATFRSERVANARIIQKAPEMLRALRKILAANTDTIAQSIAKKSLRGLEDIK